MSFKPADFFLSVIEFFGILIPGAVFLLLEADVISAQSPSPVLEDLRRVLADLPGSNWVAAALAAFVLGHLLFAAGVALNPVHRRTTSRLWQSMDRVESGRFENFHTAFSYVRLHGAEVVGEVDRAAAAYKLFRTLTVVLFADAVIRLVLAAGRPGWRVGAALALALVCFFRFGYLKKWTEVLAREYADLIDGDRRKPPATGAGESDERSS